jgi:hypothetical protein
LECWLAGDFKDLDKVIILSRESLERDADELTAIGLPEVAKILAEAAEVAIPQSELNCPYDPEDKNNYQSWQASLRRY